jgi:RNA polymerase sigma-70 factor (ECF subfamily)
MEELLRQYQRRVYAVIYRMTGRHAEADDLCQETFLQVFRGLANGTQVSDLDAWVYRIAMNVSADYLRRRAKEGRIAERLAARGEPRGEATVADPELASAVRSALDQLPPDQKAVIVLRMFEGRSHEAIARIRGIPVATARWQYFAARRKLEELLGPHL